jgi:RecJ-like exonuclease
MTIERPDELTTGDEASPDTKGGGPNVCPECGGTGRVGPERCDACKGTGQIEDAARGG